MRCPYCSHLDNKVIDSRLGKEKEAIRRRRECLGCERRYTTYERVEAVLPMVVKKDGRRESFARQKIFSGIQKACEKRPVGVETIESCTSQIEAQFRDMGEAEVTSRMVGEAVMRQLHGLDPVAYVRFASVYREFKDVNQFMSELKLLLSEDR